ncbi:hypothetical protein D8Y22_16420 [Salinadaptatus halalkaliphilus]|uniref:DUF4097 domain-containing protein n=1 Tax=Salinadaptatus halalkaliphilus TaxID=2419781 RepID=A0A4S3TKZ2_9EURY|nr:DUF4097 family beta strand repeat-containing protein [Salinadaptatus halalkaliphilus]THE63903.1 hypothetical protein D8Y22_16420 [Salinadaptatus halalkaliphilus]
MSTDTTRRRLLAAVGAGGLTALAGCSSMTPFVGRRTARSETISPDGAQRVAVHGSVGEISVVGADRDDLAVDVEKQSSSIRTDLEELVFRTERDDDRLELRSEWEGRDGWFQNQPTMNLDIDLPAELALERIDASVGRVAVREVVGDLTVEASTGEVDIAGVDGAVGARTSTGRVDISNVEALEDVHTTTGEVDLEVPAIDGDTAITTTTGTIEAAIDPDIDAELHAQTNTGTVDSSGLELAESTRSDDMLVGTLGDGGPTLRFEANTGEISLTSLS